MDTILNNLQNRDINEIIPNIRGLFFNETQLDILHKIFMIEYKNEEIKSLVKIYLNSCTSQHMFEIVYSWFQEMLKNPHDILYYLNPLKFKNFDAFEIINIDPSVNYESFLSACKYEKVPPCKLERFKNFKNL